MFVRRIPISEVPLDDEGSAEFVHKLYREKDEIFDVYKKTGSFKSLGMPLIQRAHNYSDLYISIAWTVALVTPLFYYLYIFFQTANLFSIILFLTVATLSKFSIILFKKINMMFKL